MTRNIWRFLPVMTQTAPDGVSLDETLLECKSQGISPNTIRFYHFNPPAVICGYNQAIEDEVNLSRVYDSGFDLTRRITGGGTLFVTPDQIGIACLVNKNLVPGNPSKAILWFSEAIIDSLNRLGINAVFRPKNDIVVDSRKLVGTGQAVRGKGVLFHAIILIDLDVAMMLNVLNIPRIKFKNKKLPQKTATGWCFQSKLGIEERFTTLKKELNGKVPLEPIYTALRRGFEAKFEMRLESKELLPQEEQLHQNYLSRYQSDDWIFMRKSAGGQIKTFTEKTKGGLVRVKMAVEKKVIKSIIITGDFFVFPSNAIFDLEARLKWSPAEPEAIEKTVSEFFENTSIEIPWISKEDLSDVLVNAIRVES